MRKPAAHLLRDNHPSVEVGHMQAAGRPSDERMVATDLTELVIGRGPFHRGRKPVHRDRGTVRRDRLPGHRS